MELTPSQKQTLRHTVSGILAALFPVALTAKQIHFRALQEIDFPATEADVATVLAYLSSPEIAHTREIPDQLGALPWWQATAAACRAAEKSEGRVPPSPTLC